MMVNDASRVFAVWSKRIVSAEWSGDYRHFRLEDGSKEMLGGCPEKVCPFDMRVAEAEPGWSIVKLSNGWVCCAPPYKPETRQRSAVA